MTEDAAIEIRHCGGCGEDYNAFEESHIGHVPEGDKEWSGPCAEVCGAVCESLGCAARTEILARLSERTRGKWDAEDERDRLRADLTSVLLEIEGLVSYYRGRYDDPKVQSGADVVCGALDLLLTRREKL